MKTKNEKIYYEWSDYVKDIKATDWIKCDHVIGIYRGSLGMASHISNVRNVPMSIIGFQTRDGDDKKPYWIHNVMTDKSFVNESTILIVDDIYDSGHTMNSVIDFVKSSSPMDSSRYDTPPNVLGYCLFGKTNAKDIVYSNLHDGSWIVFPWED